MGRLRRAARVADLASLVADLKAEGLIRTGAVERAFLAADRALFVPPGLGESPYVDAPLPIGHEQTVSAPHMVAMMAEALEAKPGMKVLEVGGGCGWHAAVVASLVRPGGRVVSVERLGPLAEQARDNLSRAGFADTVRVVVADGSLGYPEDAPFDRIWVAAAAPRVPPSLIGQLAPEGGRLLVPVGTPSLQELTEVRLEAGIPKRRALGGCVFVPLIGAEGF